MKILFLAHRIPYPPDKGEKIRAYHEIKYLGARHSIDLFCFADSQAECEQRTGLQAFCRTIYTEVRRTPGVAVGAARSLLRGEPLSCGCFFSRKFQRSVGHALTTESYDAIFVYCSSMAQYVPEPAPAPVVMDFVDVDSAKWAQYAQRAHFPWSWVFAREARTLARFEREAACRSHSVIVSTPREAALLGGENLRRIEVVSNGVEVPAPGQEEIPQAIRAWQPYLLFLGTMDYRPNVDAVEHFAKDILPLVRAQYPEVKFVVAGRNPTRRVRVLAQRPGVVVTGAVADAAPLVKGSTAVVAPFRIAQGIQNKILEALAAGKPVVSTSGPAEAVGARNGETLLVADAPEEFAAAVSALLANPSLDGRFDKGPEFVRRHFNWQENLRHLERTLERAAAEVPRVERVALKHAEAS